MIETLLKDKKFLISLFLILFFTFLLRLIHINSIPVFADEAIYVRWAQVMKAESTLRFLPLSDGKQPLFMWITIPFLKFISDPLVAGRLVSIFSGIGTTFGVFLLSYLFFNSKKVSLIATLVYGFIPFSFFFDRLALVDSLLTFFIVWSVIFAFLTLKTLRLDLAMITGFFLGGALLTKSPAIFVLILLPLLLFLGDSNSLKFKHLSKSVILLFVSYALGIAIQNILRLGPNFELIASRNQDYVYPISHFFINPTDPLIPHLRDTFKWLFYFLPIPTLFLLPFVYLKNNLKKLIILFAFFAIPVFAESALAKVYTARYILFTIPFFIVFISSSFLAISQTATKILYSILVLILFCSLLQNLLFIFNPQKAFMPEGERSGYLEDWTAGYGISEVSEYVRNEYVKNPSQKIVVGTEGYFGTLPDGLQIYLNDLREVIVVGIGLGIDRVPDSLAESTKSGNKTYLVINSTRFSGNPEKLGLKLIHEYPKAIKLNGTQERLLFFEVEKIND